MAEKRARRTTPPRMSDPDKIGTTFQRIRQVALPISRHSVACAAIYCVTPLLF
ncbi:hypothetical protein AL505_10508 [Escherichia coli]|nr:hypothetical protein AL505_10508 [Escherichia coli]